MAIQAVADVETRPFGMRFLVEPRNLAAPEPAGVHYHQDLQLMVTSAGNPWVREMPGPETKTSTYSDGNKPEDDGTDMY